MKVTVKDRQSLFDVAIQVLGSAEGVFALAVPLTAEAHSGKNWLEAK